VRVYARYVSNISRNRSFVNFFEREIMNFIRILYFLYLHLFAIAGLVALYAVMCVWCLTSGIMLPYAGGIITIIGKFVMLPYYLLPYYY
jgi:hypothetical protein